MELARQFNGEIIAADSRTIYKGMDVGTAKPTDEDQRAIPHHMLDVALPSERFTVVDFQRQANKLIRQIAARGHLPLLVGGTGLYIDALLYDFTFREGFDVLERQRLAALSVGQLQELLTERGISLPENSRNPRHLIRALETNGAMPAHAELRPNTSVLGLRIDKEVLAQKITHRVELMVQAGLVEEVRGLADRYGWDTPALQAPGYKAFRPYLEGEITLDEAKQRFVQNDMQYAKRQKTWFKRNPDICWISNSEEAVDLVTTYLNK
jgi:tRNA dimethylallyltransferase